MLSDIWAGWALGTDGLSAKYCEANRLGELLRQPMNTLSNAAFAVAGLLVLLEKPGGRLAGGSRLLFAASLIALGFGSAGFHASITLAAQRADMGATYAVVLALIGFCYLARRPAEAARTTAAIVLIDALFIGFDLFREGAWLLPLLMAVALGGTVATQLRCRDAHPSASFYRAIGALGVAATAWILDDHKILCEPGGWFQWHAIWHVATADAALELYRFLDRAPAPAVASSEAMEPARG